MKKTVFRFALASLFLLSGVADVQAGDDNVEKTVRSIYELISVEAGRVHQLEAFSALWHEKAHFAFPNPDGSFRFQSFGEFYDQLYIAVTEGRLGEEGFREEVDAITINTFGNIAEATVHYRLYSPATAQQFAREGIDMIQLIKTSEGWKVFSLVNQIASTETGEPNLQ